MFQSWISTILSYLAPICLLYMWRSFCRYRYRHDSSDPARSKLIAFFHPNCNDCAGGERVLWAAIKSATERYPLHSYVIYSDNFDVTVEEILAKVQRTFQIDTTGINVHLVKLRSCVLLRPKLYFCFTILGQNIGSIFVGLEAMLKCPPDVLIDTMGASFIYPLFRLLKTKVVAYVHFPTISTDMLNLVRENVSTYNNREFIARNSYLTKIKLMYYQAFAFLYRMSGQCAHIVTCNSTWTKNHIQEIWQLEPTILYPPCNTANLKLVDLGGRDPGLIVSMSQFRPEKNHQLQIEAFGKLFELLRENGDEEVKPKLAVIGSARNEDDYARVELLKKLASDLGVDKSVDFKVNLPYHEMEKLMAKASIAMHTMKNEHFGISVVEFLATGLLTLSHASGGPRLDIITEGETGFFAEDVEQFATALFKLVKMSEADAIKIRKKARDSVERFSTDTFERQFAELMKPLLE